MMEIHKLTVKHVMGLNIELGILSQVNVLVILNIMMMEVMLYVNPVTINGFKF